MTGPRVVLLHGHDDDRDRLADLAAGLVPPAASVVVPRGPLATGGGRAAWFESVDGEPDPDQVAHALGAVDEAVAAAGPGPVVLGGFSQGAALALLWLVGTRPLPAGPADTARTAAAVTENAGTAAGRTAGLFAIAGWIPDVAGIDLDLGRAAGIPVLVGHGEDDEVVPAPLGRGAARALERHAADVTRAERPVGHSLEPFLPDLQAWLRDLAAAPSPPS